MRPHARDGFTLIELLVVVTIIVVLLALLAPALDKAIEQTERTVCAARLHAWGVAIPQYSFDNKRRLLSTVRMGIATAPGATYPNLVWARRGFQTLDWSDAARKPSEWCAQTMEPYVGGVDTARLQWKNLWYCPSNKAAKDQNNTNSANAADWFSSDYAYFAQVGKWQSHATRPQDLTSHQLSGGRLLMSDTLYFEIGNRAWWFNHGPDGWSTHDLAWGGPRQTEPNISGTNQLFGDGSVRWTEADDQDRKDLKQPTTGGRWVSSGPGPDLNTNLNFYLD